MKFIRKMYDWVLHWAETPYGPLALFLLAFAESSFFPIPPDPLLIALVLGATNKAFRFATTTTIASVVGAVLGYAIGHYLWWTPGGEFTAVADFFFEYIPNFTVAQFFEIQKMYDAYGFWIVFTAGFTPIPYKIFTIASGAFNLNMLIFIFASTISRGARFFLISWLLYKYGESIKKFIDKYFDWLAIAFVILFIGGFVLVKYAF